MKHVSIAITIVVILLLAFWLIRNGSERQTKRGNDVLVQGNKIIVIGDTTLKDIAKQLDNKDIFNYDEATKTAVCNMNLIIRGKLQIGKVRDQRETELQTQKALRSFDETKSLDLHRLRTPPNTETLEMKTKVCGDKGIVVEKTGSLRMYNATLATENRKITNIGNALCTLGYSFIGDGEIIIHNSNITYMSGRRSIFLRGKANAEIRNSRIVLSDDNSLSCANVDGHKIIIDNCEFSTTGNWGAKIEGKGGSPIVISNSIFRGKASDVLNAGGEAEIILVDCIFDKNKIAFSQHNGSVAVKWTLKVKVIAEGSGKPMPNLIVEAQSVQGTGLKEQPHVVKSADAQGIAKLILTEYVAKPSATKRVEGKNNMTPHDLVIYSPDGQRVLARRKNVDVNEKGKEITIRIVE